MQKVHALDPVLSVRPFWSADHGHFSAGGAPDFLLERLARRERDIVNLEVTCLPLEKCIVFLKLMVESLGQENYLFKENVLKLKTELPLAFLKSHLQKFALLL